MEPSINFSLQRFERLAYGRRYEEGIRELLEFLKLADNRQLPADLATVGEPIAPAAYYARFATAVSALFSDPAFQLSQGGCDAFFPYHRVLASLFGAAAFGNADHILRAIQLPASAAEPARLDFEPQDLSKLTLLYSIHSHLELLPEVLWSVDRRMAVSLFLAMLSSPVVASNSAYRKAAEILAWLPARLDEVELADRDLLAAHLPWFECSYFSIPEKHKLKAALNRAIRRRLIAAGIADTDFKAAQAPGKVPVIALVLEQFKSNHSMYRCYEPALRALRPKFRLIGLGRRGVFDAVSRECFDEVVELTTESLTHKELIEAIQGTKPDMLIYPSIGMYAGAVFAANLRLAPIQLMMLGHPATSASEQIDYVILEENFLGDPRCFSEKLILVPSGSMPFTPHPGLAAASVQVRPDGGGRVRIAMPAFVRKINPAYLNASLEIAKRHKGPLSFHFLAGASGVMHLHLRRELKRWLPDAVVHPYADYSDYMRVLSSCDLCLNPFPFGNTNGVADAAALGIPFVCMDGPEAHSHIDAELSARLGLPSWLVAQSHEQYVAAALRLIDNPVERKAIGKTLTAGRIAAAIFQGTPESFGEALWQVYRHHSRIKADPRKVWRMQDLAELD